jgi:Acetyltransferase (GNAT) domain
MEFHPDDRRFRREAAWESAGSLSTGATMVEMRTDWIRGETPSEILDLVKECFPDPVARRNLEMTWKHRPEKSVILSAYEKGIPLSMTLFLAHPATVGGEKAIIYQACFTCTSRAARGRGLFSVIVEHAKRELAETGTYIVGFPNKIAEPIWVGRHDFRLRRLTRMYVPCSKLIASLMLSHDAYDSVTGAKTLVKADQYALARWKLAEYPDDVKLLEYEGSLIWGRVIKRKVFGSAAVKMFDAGGADFPNPTSFAQMIRELGRKYSTAIVRFVCCMESALGVSCRPHVRADDVEPLIWFPLKTNLVDPQFDIHNGLKDVY